MSRLIYLIVTLITKLHTKFLSLNDSYGLALSDKQLHFLIFGAFGFALVFMIQPLFYWISKKFGLLFITFSYVFTIVLVVSFAIEIGQGLTGTGDMDLYDITYGILGFLVFFLIYMIGYLIYKGIKASRKQISDQQ